MTAPAAMPLYIGDYLRDTMHLTRDQHGAYFLLICACWMNGGAIANDDKLLASIVKADDAEWIILKPIMAKFFRISPRFWTAKRVGIELEKANKLSQARVNAGKKGAEKRWQSDANANGEANGKQVIPPSFPPAPPLLPPNTTTPLNPPIGAASDGRPTRLPVDWQPNAADRQFAGKLGLDAGEVASEFRDYWSAVPGRKATRLDWHATFRNACRLYAGRHRRSNGVAGAGTHRQAGPSFTAAIRRAFADAHDEGVE